MSAIGAERQSRSVRYAVGGPGPGETPEQRLAAARAWARRLDPGTAPAPAAAPGEAQTSERLQGVIAAAERAADAIRVDAEQQAHSHLADAHRRADELTAERAHLVAELTDELIEQAGVIREHSDRMAAVLERAISDVTGKLRASTGPTETAAAPSGALLRAAQLALAGESRESIAARLRSELGIDPEPVLRRMLG